MVYCERCDRYFVHDQALWQHERDSAHHNSCDDCHNDFPTWTGLKEHYVQSKCHHYCQDCNEHFPSAESLDDHLNDEHWFCTSCRRVFKTETGLHEHNRQKHWYCVPCRRVFESENNLTSHLNSSTHTSMHVRCPGDNCGKAFVSMSAMLHHVEAGTCPSGMTRTELNRMVVRADPDRLIHGHAPATETRATNASWNGCAYECFLCHRTFKSLEALNAHLKSPRHQDTIYRCPNRTTCGAEFGELSALAQHVESGKCWVKGFKEVLNALDSFISDVRSIAIKLGF